MTKEEAILKLDGAIEQKLIHHSARAAYLTWCNTPESRQWLENMLEQAQASQHKAQERRERKAARAAFQKQNGGAA